MSKKKKQHPPEAKPPRDWLKIIGGVVLALAGFYKYQQEMRPLLDVTSPDPVKTEWKDGTFKFEIPLHFQNQGPSTAVGATTYHLFVTYPPGVKDQAETDVPDVAPHKDQSFTIIKYIDTKTLTASTNFFQYQNLLVLTTWRSDNLAHSGQVFCRAQWYRLYLTMGQGHVGSYMTLVKSKYLTTWGKQNKKTYEKLRSRFLEGETIQDAYDLQQLDWARGKSK
jgi:hypothetical protein